MPGALLGAAGEALPAGWIPRLWLAAAVACFGWALHEFGLLRLPMPQLHRQVQRHWMQRLPWNLVALGYGLQLGSGVVTRIPTAATYATLLCALLSGSGWKGALIMGTFGLSRSWLPVMIGRRVQSPESSMYYAWLFQSQQAAVKRVTGASLLLAGSAVLVMVSLGVQ